MEWATYLLWLQLATGEYCDSLLVQEPQCVESVTDCVLDGESFEFCTNGGLDD